MSGNEASKQAEPGGPLWFDLIPPEVSAVAATKHLDRGDSQRSQPTAKSGRLHLGLYLELPGDYSFGRTRHQAGLGFSWPREMSACHISRRCTREPPLSDSLSSLASRFGKAETLTPQQAPNVTRSWLPGVEKAGTVQAIASSRCSMAAPAVPFAVAGTPRRLFGRRLMSAVY